MLLAAVGLACAQGAGEGEVIGFVSAASCGLDASEAFSLDPTYFAADTFGDSLNIRIQHGADEFDFSDVLFVSVLDADEVRASQLGVPLVVGDAVDSPVRMSLSLNETCPFHDRSSIPVSFQAVSGSITFSEIYAGDGSRTTAAEFSDVHLVDPSAPDERFADLSGHFRFVYTRGRPAQVFP